MGIEVWRGGSVSSTGSRFHTPLIKLDGRFSRIRLSLQGIPHQRVHTFAHEGIVGASTGRVAVIVGGFENSILNFRPELDTMSPQSPAELPNYRSELRMPSLNPACFMAFRAW